jgi:hypothetical protein
MTQGFGIWRTIKACASSATLSKLLTTKKSKHKERGGVVRIFRGNSRKTTHGLNFYDREKKSEIP